MSKIKKMDKNNYSVYVLKVETDKENDMYSNLEDFSLTDKLQYPLFSLGFHYLIHNTKDKMELTLKFKNNEKNI